MIFGHQIELLLVKMEEARIGSSRGNRCCCHRRLLQWEIHFILHQCQIKFRRDATAVGGGAGRCVRTLAPIIEAVPVLGRVNVIDYWAMVTIITDCWFGDGICGVGSRAAR